MLTKTIKLDVRAGKVDENNGDLAISVSVEGFWGNLIVPFGEMGIAEAKCQLQEWRKEWKEEETRRENDPT